MALSLRARRSRFDDEYNENGNSPYKPVLPGGKVNRARAQNAGS